MFLGGRGDAGIEEGKQVSEMKKAFAALGLMVAVAAGAEPLSKTDLLRLAESGTDEALLVDLVATECVDFDVDATTVLELQDAVPADVLRAAISCRSSMNDLNSESSPPGTSAEAEDISLTELEPLTLDQVRVLALVPVTVEGQADSQFTGAMAEVLRKRQSRYEILDPLALQVEFENTGAFHSNAPLKSLLAAARAQGAHALLLSEGSVYRGGLIGLDPAARLDVRIVEVNAGRVLWSEGVKAVGLHFPDAKKDCTKKIAKRMRR